MAIHNGQIVRFKDLPFSIIRKFLEDMLSNKEAIICLNRMGYQNVSDMLEKYCWCRFGAFDGNPDLLKDQTQFTPEYWDCGKRGDCPYQFILCEKVWFGSIYLTKKQIEIVKLIASGRPDKQICDDAGITYFTLVSHKKNIYTKLNLHSHAEITAFAYKNNLID